jgi:HSP20 family protein
MELDHQETRRNLSKLLSLRDEISELHETLSVSPDKVPLRLDLFDEGDALRVIAEVPGVSQDKLEVALQGRNLTIAGLREGSSEAETLLIHERARGHFQRTITLPSEVEREQISAQLREGLLVLYLPKHV